MQRNTYGASRRSSTGTSRNYANTSRQGTGQRSAYPQRSSQPQRRVQSRRNSRPVNRMGAFFRNLLHSGQPWPIWLIVLAEVAVLGIALLVFALFHHVLPQKEAAVGTVSSRSTVQQTAATAAPTIEPAAIATQMAEVEPVEVVSTPVPTPEATPEPDPVGYFGTKFAEKFTGGEVVKTDTMYQSANVCVTMSQMRHLDSDIYVADIYVKDISCLRTTFAKDTFARGTYEWTVDIARRLGAIVTMNGDYYGGRSDGVVVRNGVLYRDNSVLDRDVGVLYWDGTMKCFSPDDFNTETEMANGAYQVWNFGPMLLDASGNAMETFNSKVNPNNPRAVFGYYEPGHYCLLVVDGRTKQSKGLSLKNLSALMASMGCKAAYNLDGGATASMACGGTLISNPAGDGRKCTDFIMVFDQIENVA